MTERKKPYFPLFVDLSEKTIFVVGAGTIAKRRIRSLVDFTNRLTVIAPEVNPELIKLEMDGRITIRRKKIEKEELLDADMVIAATNDHILNELIFRYCQENGILVNVCSNKEMCDFYFPGIIRTEEVVIGVTANGANHKKARSATERIKEIFSE